MVDLQTISVVIASLSVAIAALYYMVVIRNTIRTRQAQLFMNIFSSWMDPEYLRLSYKLRHMNWRDYEDFLDKYGLDKPEERLPYSAKFYFYEGIGTLVEEGLVNIGFVSKIIGTDIKNHWEKFGPVILEHRIKTENPRYFDKAEYLYNEVKRIRADEWTL